MFHVLIFVALLITPVEPQKIDISKILNGGNNLRSSNLDLERQAMAVLKSIQLSNLEKQLEKTNMGIRQNAAQLVKEQMRSMRHRISQAEQLSNGLVTLPSKIKASLTKGRDGRGSGSSSIDTSDAMPNSSRMMKRVIAVRLMKAAEELLTSSSSAESYMKRQ